MGKNSENSKSGSKKMRPRGVELWTPTDFLPFELDYPKQMDLNSNLHGYIAYKFYQIVMNSLTEKAIKDKKSLFKAPEQAVDLKKRRTLMPPSRAQETTIRRV